MWDLKEVPLSGNSNSERSLSAIVVVVFATVVVIAVVCIVILLSKCGI